jgi:nitrite reductase/ring-hydroxylating ferredoxin subunit/DMSO/TMAO reductase YedYZ heme-binding membrane subunit
VSVRYAAVNWNRNKRLYDAVLGAGVVLYVAFFVLVGKLTWRGDSGLSDEVLLLRALGTCAFLLLHVVLCIGPLARFNRRLLPLLYNRRHLGVVTFLVGAAHGALATGYYHGFGRLNPLVSLLATNTQYASLAAFPFETLGVLALAILFLMAATSHDFWQKNLSPSAWKALHMLVYPTYALLVLHVAFGALRSETSPLYVALAGLGTVTVIGLHLAAGWREWRRDRSVPRRSSECWVDVGAADEIPDSRAKVVSVGGGERVAVFRHGDQVSAVTNVCAHQRGPLGEGKIVNGCITCPWHGWEYRPENGCSPPPFAERIATYRVRVEGGRVFLNPEPLPPGTPVEPAAWRRLPMADSSPSSNRPAPEGDEFFIGWLPMPRRTARLLHPVAVLLLLIAAGTAAAVAYYQRDPGVARWEEKVTTFDGVVFAPPYPLLRIPGDPPRTLLLVSEGKFGAARRVEQVGDRRAVRVRGTLLHRDGRALLELAEGDDGIRPLGPEEKRRVPPLKGAELQILAESVTIRGEIIDPKCYLGAMKPGGGKAHKACAMLCVSGGIPPMLVTRDADRRETFYLLVTEDGGAANELVLPFVGDAVKATGRLERDGDLLILRVTASGVGRR